MESEDVIREDFPTARKGWDPGAVRAHLESLAERLSSADSVSAVAAKRVEGIVAAAEETAAEIERDARRQAEEIANRAREEVEAADGVLKEARAQAERIVAEAREEAGGSVERAQAAVESLVSQAEELRTKVGSLGESLAEGVRERVGDSGAEPEPEKEPEPPAAPAAPDVASEAPPEPAAEPEAEPEPEGESTEALIARLKESSGDGADAANGPEEHGGSADHAAARLIAMNMALDGADRAEIVARLGDDFAGLEGAGELADDVLERAGRS